eukprot:8363195-Pyramimonas_sp.AAC.1
MTLNLKYWQQFHSWRAGGLQHVALAIARRTFASKFTRVSRTEGGSFSKCGSRLSAAHSLLNKLQGLHGLRAGGFQNVALASARRTF